MSLILEPRWKSYVVETLDPVLTPEQCNEIINIGQNLPQVVAQVGVGKPTDKKRKDVDIEKRITTISWIPFNKARPIYSIIEKCLNQVNANHFGFEDVRITELGQYTEYAEKEFYDWHTDISLEMSNMPPVRKISMTLLLSDPKDFQGGELDLVDAKTHPNFKQGYALFFASFIRHRVKPIIKGNRKSLVMWFGGTPFK